MIIIGSHSKGMIGTLLLGSVAKDVVQGAQIPVLVVPPPPKPPTKKCLGSSERSSLPPSASHFR